MKKTIEFLRKSDRIKEYDPDILKDLRDLYGPKNFKTHMKRFNQKKKRTRRIFFSIFRNSAILHKERPTRLRKTIRRNGLPSRGQVFRVDSFSRQRVEKRNKHSLNFIIHQAQHMANSL